MVALLFVCTGNICRSPTAEGVMRKLLVDQGLDQHHRVDSAGLFGYHSGEAPDWRTRQVARQQGVPLDDLCARSLVAHDADRFDLLLAMDKGHLEEMRARLPLAAHAKIRLFLSVLDDPLRVEVADPYYGSIADFEQTFRDVAAGCQAWLALLLQGEHGMS